MKKKIISMILAITMIGMLTACGASENTSSDNNETVVETEADTNEQDSANSGAETDSEDPLKTASEAEIDGELVINVGDHANDEFLWKVAKAKGFFEEEFTEDNISVNVETFPGGPGIFEAMMGGSLQFGIASTDPLINYASAGADIKIVSQIEVGNKLMLIAVQKDSGIKSLEDLKGHSVAVSVGTFRHNFLITALKSVGLTGDDIQILNLTNKDIITAMQAGEADAAVLSANNYVSLQDTADVLVYADDYKTNYHVLAVDNAFGKKYPNTTARVIRLVKRTIDWISENKEESVQIYMDATGVERESAEIGYDTLLYGVTLDEEGIISDMSATIAFNLENGTISNEVDAASLIDSSYIKLAGIE